MAKTAPWTLADPCGTEVWLWWSIFAVFTPPRITWLSIDCSVVASTTTPFSTISKRHTSSESR